MIPSSNTKTPPTRYRQFRPHPPPSRNFFSRPLVYNHGHQNLNRSRLFRLMLLSNHHCRDQLHNGCPTLSIETLISECNPKPLSFDAKPSGTRGASLFFQHQSDAADVFVSFWERRLAGDHYFTPMVEFAGTEDVNSRVKCLFMSYAEKLLEGELVQKLERDVNALTVEIDKCSALLRKPNVLRVLNELQPRKKRLVEEREGMVQRLEEFKFAVKCVLYHLQGKEVEELPVLNFKNWKGCIWSKIHDILLRERRRLEDGLPIYGFRREILQQIHLQQVTVLVGETGSGKSTQLVQFLVDSGVATSGSILCTQPRRIAAISLEKRVGEEIKGCYEDSSVICYPTYSSAQRFNSKVIYMTDHCLMQHVMEDKTLSGVSCIIIDEAHERSLNTDLLLASVKKLLIERPDLRLVIMSATLDSGKFSEYFFGCGTFHVLGKSFPVEMKYVPGASECSSAPNHIAPYVSEVVRVAMEIHQIEKEGAILAFLTSQLEVEWACEKFQSPSAIVLPLHGKLSHEEQREVFQNFPGKRKVIFATNLAETSLTIPGVKYVVDSGMVKESRFEPTSGINLLRVSKISQSSANQRAGRAGRTEPGKCYRLYSEFDYESMAVYQEPEIRKVHIGIAVLRILALGVRNVKEFDFIDAPSAGAVETAIKNLVQLGAIVCRNNAFELTLLGRHMVKLGIEPRLAKIILESCRHGLKKEGVVLAAVMANASTIFCRIGNNDDKQKSDCLKLQFCHQDGDLFTLLTVYKEWESVPDGNNNRNKWCWNNSINAKTMRRCKETVSELENCLKNELSIIIPTYWVWSPYDSTEHDKTMKTIIVSSLGDNVAMYSGYDRLGYDVVLSGEYFQLHPSCSLQVYSQKPEWVVFADVLSISSQYLVCVTAVDLDCLSAISPQFELSKVLKRKLQLKVVRGFGSTALKRFCGRTNNNLFSLLSCLRTDLKDERIGIEVSVENNEVLVYASEQDMEKVYGLVSDALEYEVKWMSNECLEKLLYLGGRAGVSPPVALFGAGAKIRHLELENRYLSVDVFLSGANRPDDKGILKFLEKSVSPVCSFHRHAGSGYGDDAMERWGRVTFLTPETARKALELNGFELSGSLLKLSPSSSVGCSNKLSLFPAVKAKITWPRRYSKGYAVVRCEGNDAEFVVKDCFHMLIRDRPVFCELSTKEAGCALIKGLDRDTSEVEILEVLQMSTKRRILDVFLIRGDAVNNPSPSACEEAILKEIAPFMPNQCPLSNYCHAQVYCPEPKDTFMKAWITFDGRLHLEAAKALQHIQGKVLTGCFSWQKLRCQQIFHSSISCPAPAYLFIERQLNFLLNRFKHRPGVNCSLERNENGSYRVKISANATKTVAELRRPFEQLMNGKTVDHGSLSPAVLQLLFSREGKLLMKSLQQEMGTYILFDRHNLTVRIFGPENQIVHAEQKLVKSLLALNDNKKIDIPLRGSARPHDIMKKVVEKFGPDLRSLKAKFPGAAFTLNTRHHVISFCGKEDLRLRVERFINDFARSLNVSGTCEEPVDDAASCPICLCEIEDCYPLELCGHIFCRACLVDQLESAMRSRDGFPICCAQEGCRRPILLTDLKSLLSSEKLDDLFKASLGAFVASSGGTYRFCPSPDCPSVYRVSNKGMSSAPFVCGACYAETCTKCHLEHHPGVSCERYKEFKEDPDLSLREWCKGKDQVKNCPVCGYVIEKVDGCNHVECRCCRHICWVCLEYYSSSEDCYSHLRQVHQSIT